MANFEIPTSPQNQKFQIALAGVTYTLSLYWNSVASIWVLDLLDAQENAILTGIALVANVDLLEPYEYLGIGGRLIAQTDNAANTPPNFNTLGSTGHLYFVTT